MTIENPTAREVFLGRGRGLEAARREEMENNFFRRLRLPNGTAKTTYAHRLDDVAQACNRCLARAVPPLRLMDLGISSGVTTREWMDMLERLHRPYRIDAVDVSIYGVIESLGAQVHVLRDSRGRALQFELAGYALSNHYGWGLRSFLKRLVPVSAARAFFALGSACQRARHRMTRVGIALLARGLHESSRLKLHEADLLQIGRFVGPYHLIRAANVLNRSYFDEPQLESILRQLDSLLDAGGYLVVVRTPEGARGNDGSVFLKERSGRLAVVERFGAGSELEPLVARLNAARPGAPRAPATP